MYEPIQRITKKETGGEIYHLVLINQKKEEEEEFASCSNDDTSIIIWRRKGKGDKFQIKQKIENAKGVEGFLYISLTNEFIHGSWDSPSLLLFSKYGRPLLLLLLLTLKTGKR